MESKDRELITQGSQLFSQNDPKRMNNTWNVA
jgi:hypothetical protein